MATDLNQSTSTTQKRVIDLLNYIEQLTRLQQRVIFNITAYKQTIFHEATLSTLPGIHQDPPNEESDVWIKIERLQRQPPPPRPKNVEPWLSVTNEPAMKPKSVMLRVISMHVDDAQGLLERDAITEDDILPAQKTHSGYALEESRDVTLRLARLPDIQTDIETYLRDKWRQWAEEEESRRRTIGVYETLFTLYQSIRSDASERPLQLVLGLGFVQWKTSNKMLNHPLIEQGVEIELDAQSSILIKPRETDATYNLALFDGLHLPGSQALQQRLDVIDQDPETSSFSPFDRLSFEPALRATAQLLQAGAVYWPDQTDSLDDRALPEPGEVLHVTDHWALYAKPRDEKVIAQDISKLKSMAAQNTDFPDAISSFVNDPCDKKPDFQEAWTDNSQTTPNATGLHEAPMAPIIEEYYFPKAFNKEQQQIVKQLARSTGVVVQGPPGTGKTHTIANIICHYLAMGKRVLVTSKGEAALGVLRGHLPEDIQGLAISLLTTEREGLRQLQHAVDLLATTIGQMDSADLQRSIQRHESEIQRHSNEINAVDAKLAAFAEKHLKPLKLEDGRKLLPEELARSLVEDRDDHAWLQDRPRIGREFAPRIKDEDLARARQIRSELGKDLQYRGIILPALSQLPDEQRFRSVHRAVALAARIDRDDSTIDLPKLAIEEHNAIARAKKLLDELKSHLKEMGLVQNTPWTTSLKHQLNKASDKSQERQLLTHRCQQMQDLEAIKGHLIDAVVRLPDGAEENGALIAAAEKGAEGRKPVGLFDFQLKRQIKNITVNRKAVTDQVAWQQVLKHLRYKSKVADLAAAWPALQLLGVPPLTLKDAHGAGIATMLRLLEAVLNVCRNQSLHEAETRQLFPSIGTINFGDAGEVRTFMTRLEGSISRHRLEDSRKNKFDIVKHINATGSGSVGRELYQLVLNRWGDPNENEDGLFGEYQAHLSEIDRLNALKPDFASLAAIAEQIAAMGGPLWSKSLLHEPAINQPDLWTPNHWRESWNWWRKHTYLCEIDGRNEILSLTERRRTADAKRNKLFADLVRDRAYLALKRTISPRVKAALQKFLVAIRKVGKGTGKGANIWRAEARSALADASQAVPCWIMPHWRVSESLPPIMGDFDLVIVDEASQSDLFALPAIIRAKKLLIVGDDKQVSPTASFIPIRQIEQLKQNYLKDTFFGTLMLPGNSLYDLALAVFSDSKLMLREHFRCVEPIIRFSMQFYMASDKAELLYPVRIAKASERLDPPLIAIHVPHGEKSPSQINRAEADVIVDEIEALTKDPDMAGRSIGVVSLIGSRQAQLIQSRILERLGDRVFKDHDLACGDSTTFQGKERDIMFISMVECARTATSKTARLFEQRFNVALSRARDRMILVYSVDEARLKAEDLKAKILRHFHDPMPTKRHGSDDPLDLCDSAFERSVLKFLLDKGYRVIPQLKVGTYAIDIVVEGNEDRRLAVELDGDKRHGLEHWLEDLYRQRVLERCGWRFWRCWGSSYQLDPKACLDDLEQTLAQIGITPVHDQQTAISPYSVFRTALLPDLDEITQTDGQPFAAGVTDETGDSNDRYEQTMDPGTELQVVELEAAEPQSKASLELQEPATSDHDSVIDVGDRFVMIYLDQPERHFSLTMTDKDHNPEVGFVSREHVIFRQFVGTGVEEQLDVEIDGKLRQAVILTIDKAPMVISGKIL